MDEVLVSDLLARGRVSYAKRAWLDAHESLSRADDVDSLEPEDLELLARSAYMLGRDDDYVRALERAHHAHLDAGEVARAAGCTWWLGHNLLMRGESARAAGWFSRGDRLLEREGDDCVERGYLLVPAVLRSLGGGDAEGAYATAVEIGAIAERFGDRDLVTIALMSQGHALVRQRRAAEGLRLVDETMVAVTTGELSPIVAGIVYCNTIVICREAHDVRRAREWTNALTEWCDRQPAMVAHTGVCLVHRAEVMQLHGAWRAALVEAQQGGDRLRGGVLNQRRVGNALYVQGEVHRLQGEPAAAEEAYRRASRPRLRAPTGPRPVAARPGRRGRCRRRDPPNRGRDRRAPAARRLLPAYVEIMLAVGELEEARRAADELESISTTHPSELLAATAAHAQGAVALAQGDARAALTALRRALSTWQELEAPYEAARARALVGQACRSLGDDDTAALELEAARAAFEDLGAKPDLIRVRSLIEPSSATDTHGLTARELQVLRLVAEGKTNRAIATELVLSERTVDRHVSNVFGKLGVSSRAAATAFAYEHQLL